jgi:hypothetical protein
MLSQVILCRRALYLASRPARPMFVPTLIMGAIAFASVGCARLDPWNGNISFSNIHPTEGVSSMHTAADLSCPLTGTAHSANFSAQVSASGSVNPTASSPNFKAQIGVYGVY